MKTEILKTMKHVAGAVRDSAALPSSVSKPATVLCKAILKTPVRDLVNGMTPLIREHAVALCDAIRDELEPRHDDTPLTELNPDNPT